MRRCIKKQGFTLVELLVVISIIALLLSILMPALNAAREKARRVVCGSSVKQLMLGAITYSIDNRNQIPIWWDGVSRLGSDVVNVSAGNGVATANGTAEHLKYYGRKVNLGLLYPDYIKDGHVFYCKSKTANDYDTGDKYGVGNDDDFKNMLPSDPAYATGTVASSFQYRGSLDPAYLKYPSYKVIRFLEKSPNSIILADMGGWKYGSYKAINNHVNSKGQPVYFNTGYADGHVAAYNVKRPSLFPITSTPNDAAAILRRMEVNQY